MARRLFFFGKSPYLHIYFGSCSSVVCVPSLKDEEKKHCREKKAWTTKKSWDARRINPNKPFDFFVKKKVGKTTTNAPINAAVKNDICIYIYAKWYGIMAAAAS